MCGGSENHPTRVFGRTPPEFLGVKLKGVIQSFWDQKRGKGI